MTSPLRRAREEVAVNIAVTGFVSKLLPTQTKNLAKEMEILQGTLGKQRASVKSLETQHKAAVRQFGESSTEAQNLAQQINLGKRRADELNETIKEQRTQLRGLSNTNADALNKVRGFGIALGVSVLALGGFGAAAVSVAGNIRELEAIAFRTGTTLSFLQSSTRRYTAIFGDADFAKGATQSLAEFHNQVQLIRTGQSSLNFGQLAIGGINPSRLQGLNPNDLRERLLQQVRRAQGDPRIRAALQAGIGGQLFDALSGEINAPASTFSAPVITKEQQGVLAGIRRDFGEFRVTLTTVAEIVTIAVVPAMRLMFRAINGMLSPIFSFISNNQTTAKVLGFVAVALFSTVAAVSAFAGVLFIAKIIATSFGITISTLTGIINFFRISNLLNIGTMWAMNTAMLVDNVLFKVNAVVVGVNTVVRKAWTLATGAAIGVSAGFSLGLVRNNILLIAHGSFVGLSTARVWAWNIGMVTARGLLISKAVVLGALTLIMKGWAIVTGIATAAQWAWTLATGAAIGVSAGFSLGLVRNNILLIAHGSFVGLSTARVWAWNIGMVTARGLLISKAVVLGALTLIMKGWAIVAGIATAAQWALNIALTANPIGIIIVAVGLLVVALGVAIFFIIKYRSQIWDFFQGWGQAVWLVLGPIGLLIIAIINVIKYWGQLKGAFGAIKRFFGFGGNDDSARASIPSPGSGGRGGGQVNVRENVTQYNTYNITGETNPERIADDVESRQNRNLQSNVSSRSQRFGLAGA